MGGFYWGTTGVPDGAPVPEGRRRPVGHISATVGAVVEVGAGAVPRAPGRIVDEVPATAEFHRPVGPGIWVPVGATVGPGGDHLVGRIAGEDVVDAWGRRQRRPAGRDEGGQNRVAVLVGGEDLPGERDHDHLADAGVIGDRDLLLEVDGARQRLLFLVELRTDRLEGSLIRGSRKLSSEVVDR